MTNVRNTTTDSTDNPIVEDRKQQLLFVARVLLLKNKRHNMSRGTNELLESIIGVLGIHKIENETNKDNDLPFIDHLTLQLDSILDQEREYDKKNKRFNKYIYDNLKNIVAGQIELSKLTNYTDKKAHNLSKRFNKKFVTSARQVAFRFIEMNKGNYNKEDKGRFEDGLWELVPIIKRIENKPSTKKQLKQQAQANQAVSPVQREITPSKPSSQHIQFRNNSNPYAQLALTKTADDDYARLEYLEYNIKNGILKLRKGKGNKITEQEYSQLIADFEATLQKLKESSTPPKIIESNMITLDEKIDNALLPHSTNTYEHISQCIKNILLPVANVDNTNIPKPLTQPHPTTTPTKTPVGSPQPQTSFPVDPPVIGAHRTSPLPNRPGTVNPPKERFFSHNTNHAGAKLLGGDDVVVPKKRTLR